MHAYAVSRTGANTLLGRIKGTLQGALDIDVQRWISSGAVAALTFHPNLFHQDVVGTSSSLRSKGEAWANGIECVEASPFYMLRQYMRRQYVSSLFAKPWVALLVVLVPVAVVAALVGYFYWRKHRKAAAPRFALP